MNVIDRLPWHDNYILILEGKRIAEKDIEDLENPEKQFQRIKKFYEYLGADYSKNNWLTQVEEDISLTRNGEEGRLVQLKNEVKFANVLEKAVQKQDDESICALNIYRNDENYKTIIRQVMFYIGVSKVKSDPNFIKKAYDAICKNYPLERASVFVDEGVYYFVYYFQCIQGLIEKYNYITSNYDIRNQIRVRCYHAKLMLNSYSTDIYLANEIKLILSEIEVVEQMVKYEENEIWV